MTKKQTRTTQIRAIGKATAQCADFASDDHAMANPLTTGQIYDAVEQQSTIAFNRTPISSGACLRKSRWHILPDG